MSCLSLSGKAQRGVGARQPSRRPPREVPDLSKSRRALNTLAGGPFLDGVDPRTCYSWQSRTKVQGLLRGGEGTLHTPGGRPFLDGVDPRTCYSWQSRTKVQGPPIETSSAGGRWSVGGCTQPFLDGVDPRTRYSWQSRTKVQGDGVHRSLISLPPPWKDEIRERGAEGGGTRW